MSLAVHASASSRATWTAAEAEIGAIVPDDLPDTLDHFLQFRIADLSVDPEAQPWLGRAIVLTEADGTRRIIGSCGFHAPPDADGRVEVGYRVEPAYRRQGSRPRPSARCSTGRTPTASIASGRRSRRATSASLAIIGRLGFRQTGVQIDDIDGEELVFQLDGWPPVEAEPQGAAGS